MFNQTIVDIFNQTWPMLLIITVIISQLRIVYLVKTRKRFELYNDILAMTFIVYIMCLFYVVTFQDVSWSTSNFIPFKEMFRYEFGSIYFIKNVLGNMLLFIPFGFFVSYFLKLEKVRSVFLMTFITSITIEVTQLVIGRVFDVDDILLNIIGGIIGYFVYRFFKKIGAKIPSFFRKAIFANIIVIVLGAIVLLYLINIIKVGG